MNFDFPFILFTLSVVTVLVVLVDKLYVYCRYTRLEQNSAEPPKLVKLCRSLLPVFVIVLLIRSFAIEPFRVPTGSLEPTVMPGDFILSNKFSYGLRMPVWGNLLLPIGKPKRGDIIIFHTPQDQQTWLVKRLIGLPGDKISYINKQLYINGEKAEQRFIKNTEDVEGRFDTAPAKEYQENLLGVYHNILVRPDIPAIDFKNLQVPQGHYFVMGDNRDDSEDSRWWGVLPAEYLEGKAFLIWFSVDQFDWTNIRWRRIGTSLLPQKLSTNSK